MHVAGILRLQVEKDYSLDTRLNLLVLMYSLCHFSGSMIPLCWSIKSALHSLPRMRYI